MNKKLFFIPIGIGLVILLIIKIIEPDPVHGNKNEMEVPRTEVDSLESKGLKALNVIIDDSKSMRGYVDFNKRNDSVFAKAKPTMITTVADFMGNVDSHFNTKSTAWCGTNKYTSESLIEAMRNYSAFSGGTTELDVLTQKAIEMVSDTGVSVIVSDMILSYGPNVVEKNGWNYNYHALPDLSSKVGNQFKKLKKDGTGVLILKYTSDFNGTYYYNCTENRKNGKEFMDKLLKKRPYYLFVIGKEKYIKALCLKNCFPEPDEVFSTLKLDETDLKSQTFEVEEDGSKLWNIGEVNGDNKEPICLWTKDNFGDQKAEFKFKFDKIVVPLYAVGNLKTDFERKDVVSSAEFHNSLESLTVTLNPFDKLPKEAKDVEIELRVTRDANTNSLDTLDVDYGITPKQLENKTWGFASIIKKIYEAYGIKDSDSYTIAKLKFSISKK